MKIPPLCAGDRLTRAEFERRYQAMPEVKKAELIEGVVYMPRPVSVEHSRVHGAMVTALGADAAATSGVVMDVEATLRLDGDNMPQPDALLWIPGRGRARLDGDGRYLEGAPELIVEVAASSASYDLHDKLRAYRRAGVQEYVVCRVWDRVIDWFLGNEGQYEAAAPAEGVFQSRQFAGLWLKADALLAGNLAAVLPTLQPGLASSEHAAFCQQLVAAN